MSNALLSLLSELSVAAQMARRMAEPKVLETPLSGLVVDSFLGFGALVAAITGGIILLRKRLRLQRREHRE